MGDSRRPILRAQACLNVGYVRGPTEGNPEAL
jgi:hypothetical protein